MADPKPVNNWIFSNIEALHTSRKAEWFKKYSASVKEMGKVEGADSFNAYDQNRIKGAEGFTKVNTPGGSTLSEKLRAAAPPEGDAAKLALTNAFKPTEATKTAKAAFSSEMSHIPDVILAHPKDFHPGVVASTIQALKGEAANAIRAQHTHEKNELTALFANDTFRANLQISLQCTNADLASVKTDMLTTLGKSQEEELKAFEKSLNISVHKLLYGLKKEFERISFLGYWSTRDKAMREEIMRLARENAENQNDPAFLQLNGETGNATLKNVNVRDLKKLKALGGQIISKTGDNTYTVALNRLFEFRESIYEKIISLAATLKAMGYDSIVFDVSHSDPKKAEELARRAYESAIRAGFDPAKITINIGGEAKLKYDDKGKLEKDELFKERSERLNMIKQTAKQISKNVKTMMEGDPDQVQKLRTRLKAQNPANAVGNILANNAPQAQAPQAENLQAEDLQAEEPQIVVPPAV